MYARCLPYFDTTPDSYTTTTTTTFSLHSPDNVRSRLIFFFSPYARRLDFLVQLDTGSSDLWVKGPSHPLPNANTSVRIPSYLFGPMTRSYTHVAKYPKSNCKR